MPLMHQLWLLVPWAVFAPNPRLHAIEQWGAELLQ